MLPQPQRPSSASTCSRRATRALLREQQVAARARLPDPQPAAPRPRVRAGLRPRAADARGLYAGVVLNPLIGETKGDDVPARRACAPTGRCTTAGCSARATRTRRSVARARLRPDRGLQLLGLDIKMFYGGPKEAVMHGIYRQNFGFTDIVIGRKHADAPYRRRHADLGRLRRPGDLRRARRASCRSSPCKIGFAAFYESLGRVDLMENHPDEKPVVDQRHRGARAAPRRRAPGSAHHAARDRRHPDRGVPELRGGPACASGFRASRRTTSSASA